MRTTEERIAEINRRSMLYIKRKKAILLSCVPVILCICFWGAYVGLQQPHKETDLATPPAELQDMASNTNATIPTPSGSLLSVQILGPGTDICLTDNNTLSRFQAVWEPIIATVNKNNAPSLGVSATPTDTWDPNTDYLITLTGQDGNTTEFLLTDGVLLNKETSDTYLPDAQQLIALFTCLDIPFDPSLLGA